MHIESSFKTVQVEEMKINLYKTSYKANKVYIFAFYPAVFSLLNTFTLAPIS